MGFDGDGPLATKVRRARLEKLADSAFAGKARVPSE
jgi:hypothetical protein